MKRFLAILLGLSISLGTAGYLHYDVYADDDVPAITTESAIKQEVLKNLDQVNLEFTIPTKIPAYKSKEVDKMFKNIMEQLSRQWRTAGLLPVVLCEEHRLAGAGTAVCFVRAGSP